MEQTLRQEINTFKWKSKYSTKNSLLFFTTYFLSKNENKTNILIIKLDLHLSFILGTVGIQTFQSLDNDLYPIIGTYVLSI